MTPCDVEVSDSGGMKATTLSTARLTLAPPTGALVDAITEACQDPELQARVPIPVPYTREHAVAYVGDHSAAGWRDRRRCTWAIDHDGTFVGVIGIDVQAPGRGEFGYWATAPSRGHGYMTEAAAAVVEFAFAPEPEGLGLTRLAWRAFAGNVASGRIARRLGFRFEGVVRLGADGRNGLEDDWTAGLLVTDDRAPQPWPVLD